MKRLFYFLLCFSFYNPSFARSIDSCVQVEQQNSVIKGKVLDVNGSPIIGATVMSKETSDGTITDVDGNFELQSKCSSFVISCIGYKSKTINVRSNTTFYEVILEEDTKLLDEVVVVGYGVQKKVNLTGSVESVNSKSIVSKPVTSVAQALTGEMTGVTVRQTSSQPGAYAESIQIRGVGTWGNSSPLILVDGIEMGMDKVNPYDIESVTVLKDAASAAIYGSRAGNGVILITTKKGGDADKPLISFSTNWGIQAITKMPDKADALTYCMREDKRKTNDGKSPVYTDLIDKMQNGEWNPDYGLANTDWFGEVLHPALQQNHNVSITGKSKNTSYMLSLGYLNQKSVVGENTSYERYNARLNTNTKLTSWLNVDMNMSYFTGFGEQPGSGVTNVMKHAFGIEPYLPVQFSDGTWVYSGKAQNPVRLGTTDDYGYIHDQKNNFSGLVSPEINFWGFTLKGVFAYERQVSKSDEFVKTVKYDTFIPEGTDVPTQSEITTVAENWKKDYWAGSQKITTNVTLGYENTFNKHYVKALIGASREKTKSDDTSAQIYGLPNNEIDAIGAGTTKPSIGGGYSDNALASYFGRVNYVYDDRYLFEANMRRDGSSIFARGHRWGYFPSFSLGWRISEERFFTPLKKYIDNLKLRGSYGKLGNNRIASYQFLSVIGANNSDGYVFGDKIQNVYYESIIGNQDITWEKLASVNVGLDMSLLNNRLSVSAEYFKRNTTDILLALPASGTLGIAPPTTNAAEVMNKGWELSLNWNDKINDFGYNVSFNLSHVKNEVVDLKGYESPKNSLTILKEGEPINALYGWEVLGICRTDEDYEKYAPMMQKISPKFSKGDLIYKDLTGEGELTDDDKHVIGNQIPEFTYGLRLGFEWKNLDFSCFLQGVLGCDGYLLNEAQQELMNVGNTYDPETNVNSKYPRLMQEDYPLYGSSDGYYSSFWVQDASYMRIKNLQIGYTFRNLQKYHIRDLRISFSGENIATFTKYQGYDPESPLGMRGWMYPLVGVYSFGLNLTF